MVYPTDKIADMDLWVVATLAAAGYLSKYWQNISKREDMSPQRSYVDSKYVNLESSDHPFHRLTQNRILGKDVYTDERKDLGGRYLDMNCLDVASVTHLASTNGFENEKLQASDNNLYDNVLSLSNSPRDWVRESLKEDEREERPSSTVVDNYQHLLPCPSTRGTSSFYGSGRKTGSLKTKIPYGQFTKPQNSLESCLMAQFYKKNEMEEYVSCSSPRSTPTTGPFFLNEEFQFDRKNRENFSKLTVTHNKMQKEVFFKKNKHVHGVLQLPKIWSSETPKKRKVTRGCRQDGNKYNFGKMVHPNRALDEDGLLDGSVLFCFGISVGITSSFLSNKREVDQLKGLLKQTEDLVQDLQEELEMKDSLTVQELINENCESTDTCGNSFPDRTLDAFSAKLNMDNATKFDSIESYDRKANESSDSMSKIEAELEVELDRLGMGLATNTYSNEARVSDLIELDPEFFDDFAEGELIADIHSEQCYPWAKPNRDRNHSTTCSGNYKVSPWELSLRLHEVIQSRLEMRVNELETALQNSQKKVFMKSRSETLWRASSNSSKLQSSSEESPISNREFNFTTRPLIMDLSGEALDAYNEACKELTKMEDSEEHTGSDFCINNAQNLNEFDHLITCQSDGAQISVPPEINNEKVPNSQVQKIVGDEEDDENDDGDDDEVERELILKIVEKTRKGSPVVLNAQRWLFSLDEEEI